MPNILMYSNSGAKTGRLLARRLGLTPRRTYNSETRAGIIIRYGSTERVRRRPQRVVNKLNNIVLASNKLESLLRMSENEIPVPTVWRNNEEGIAALEFPCLARKSNHSQGNDILLIVQPRDLTFLPNGYTHFTKLIQKSKEYRVHVVFDTCTVKRKVVTNNRTEDFVETYFNKPYLWNYENGHVFHTPTERVPRRLRMLAMDVLDRLDLDFGAVDIIEDVEGNLYVLEVNTAPSLKTLDNIDIYAQPLGRELNLELQELTQEEIDNEWQEAEE